MTRLLKSAFLTIGLFFMSASVFAATQTPVFVSPKWAYDHRKQVKFVDLSQQYQKYHLPGAIMVNYGWLIRPQGKRRMEMSGGANYMVKALSELGISPKDDVVIYDDIGELESSRLYWELRKLGHKKVSLLDGGSVAWILDGYPVTQKMVKHTKTHYPLPKKTYETTYTATKQDVLAAIKNPKIHLLDARSEQEYLGSKKVARSGHIPSAVFFPWQASVNPQNQFKQRSTAQLKNIFTKLGLTNKNDEIIVYCHTGHRAARLFTLFESQGYKNVKLYDGSMQEWEADITLPVKQGKQA